MQPLTDATNPPRPVDECAALMLDTVPLVMRAIRAEMRSHRSPDLSVPQFRALLFLHRQPGASLSAIAEHVGITLPSMSKLVDKLVTRGLVDRQEAAEDRRRVTLTLTAQGQSVLAMALRATQSRLAEKLDVLSPAEQITLMQAMRILRPIFTPDAETTSEIAR
jgi:DNA-binding MarR family transcriptional regulator